MSRSSGRMGWSMCMGFAMLLGAAVMFLPATAHADSFTYTVDGSTASGGTVTGSFTIQKIGVNEVVTAANITADGQLFSCVGAPSNYCQVGGNSTNDLFNVGSGPSHFVQLVFPAIGFSFTNPPPSWILTSGTGFSYCASVGCGPNGGFGVDAITSGKLTLVPMPEPASAMLLLTGLAGLGILRRRRPVAP